MPTRYIIWFTDSDGGWLWGAAYGNRTPHKSGAHKFNSMTEAELCATELNLQNYTVEPVTE